MVVADGSVVALAVTLGTKLATMDGTVLKAFPRHAVPLAGR